MRDWEWDEWVVVFLFVLSLCGLVFSLGLLIYDIRHGY